MKYLIAFLILKFVITVVIDYFTPENQVFLWSMNLLTQPVLLSLAVKDLIKDPRIKVVAFVVMVASVTALLAFIVEWFLYEKFKNISVMINAITFLVLVPLSFNAICRLFTMNPTQYSEDKSYFAFKKPSNIFGLIASLVKSPYGHCVLITKGRMFKFSNGILGEFAFKPSKDYFLKEIKTVSLCKPRKLLGQRWSIFNNCFTIFRKFK